MEYSNNMLDVYKNIEECNPHKKRKLLIVFDDIIADMINNKKKLNPIVTELHSLTQSYSKVPKDVRLNSTHIFIHAIRIKENFNKLL